MTAAVLGILYLLLMLGISTAVAYGVHVLVRPRGAPDVRTSEALRELAPRGGRHRFHVRLLEAGQLVTLWIIATAPLGVWVVSDGLSVRAGVHLIVFTAGVLIATWWAWRRGVLRPVSRPVEPDLLASVQRRRERG